MKTYKLRVLYDAKDDQEIFRDIVLTEGQNLEQLHKTIVKSMDFEGDELASFYQSGSDWEKGKEFPLEDMGDEEDAVQIMKKIKIEEVAGKKGDRMLYVYDFLKMSTFLCEVTEVGKKEEAKKYPLVTATQGDFPEETDDEGEEDDDDIFADDPDLAESYYTKVSVPGAPKKGKKAAADDDDDEDLFADTEDGFDDEDFGNASDYDEYY
jgi:hypothetical protein